MEHLGERYIEREVERFVKGMHTYTPAQLRCMAQHYASALEDHEHELHRIHALREEILGSWLTQAHTPRTGAVGL
jgi:hypothetical protein